MLRRAAECRVLAKAALQADARLIFLEIAETWEMLARQQDFIVVPDAGTVRPAVDPDPTTGSDE
jgi:hypothetical protein